MQRCGTGWVDELCPAVGGVRRGANVLPPSCVEIIREDGIPAELCNVARRDQIKAGGARFCIVVVGDLMAMLLALVEGLRRHDFLKAASVIE